MLPLPLKLSTTLPLLLATSPTVIEFPLRKLLLLRTRSLSSEWYVHDFPRPLPLQLCMTSRAGSSSVVCSSSSSIVITMITLLRIETRASTRRQVAKYSKPFDVADFAPRRDTSLVLELFDVSWRGKNGAMSTKLRASIALAFLIAFSAFAAPAPTAHAQAEPPKVSAPAVAMGTVVIVHGLEGVPADVYLDGSTTPALSAFDFRRVTDPLALPIGTHRADIRRAGDAPTVPPIMSGVFDITANQQTTVAALLDPTGQPSWLAFPNDMWTTQTANGELRLRHFAASGSVTFDLNDTVERTVTNMAVAGQTDPVTVAPGVQSITVRDANDGTLLVATQTIDVRQGSIVNLYLTGRANSGSLALLAQNPPQLTPAAQVAQLQEPTPSLVASGNSGLLARGTPSRSVPGGSFVVPTLMVFVALTVTSRVRRAYA